MTPSCYHMAASMLLCAEDNISAMGLEEEVVVVEVMMAGERGCVSPDLDFGSDLFPPQSTECVARLVEREREHMPTEDYGDRLRVGGGSVDLRVRAEAIDWIWKSQLQAYTKNCVRFSAESTHARTGSR